MCRTVGLVQVSRQALGSRQAQEQKKVQVHRMVLEHMKVQEHRMVQGQMMVGDHMKADIEYTEAVLLVACRVQLL